MIVAGDRASASCEAFSATDQDRADLVGGPLRVGEDGLVGMNQPSSWRASGQEGRGVADRVRPDEVFGEWPARAP